MWISFITIIECIIGIGGVLAGIFLIIKPKSAISIQQKFYQKINWQIEPISWAKEIRNTKIMGYISASLATLIILNLFKVLTK